MSTRRGSRGRNRTRRRTVVPKPRLRNRLSGGVPKGQIGPGAGSMTGDSGSCTCSCYHQNLDSGVVTEPRGWIVMGYSPPYVSIGQYNYYAQINDWDVHEGQQTGDQNMDYNHPCYQGCSGWFQNGSVDGNADWDIAHGTALESWEYCHTADSSPYVQAVLQVVWQPNLTHPTGVQ